jgi:ABC-type multidrug transport system fused ATPase/permease subunit
MFLRIMDINERGFNPLSSDKETSEKTPYHRESRYTTGIWATLVASLFLVILMLYFLNSGDYLLSILFGILLVLDILALWYLLRSLRRFELTRQRMTSQVQQYLHDT